MATDIEECANGIQEPFPNDDTTSKKAGKDGRLCRRRALIVLQVLEMAFALIAMLIGIHAYDEALRGAAVTIILGALLLIVLPIELYLEHGRPKIFHHWITLGLDIFLLVLWSTAPGAALRNPHNITYYDDDADLEPQYCAFFLLLILSVIEVVLLASHIGVRAHQMKTDKRGKARLAKETQAQQVTGGQERESDIQSCGTSLRQPRSLTPYGKGKGQMSQTETAHPPGHRQREFSPEALYQLSLQMTQEDARHCRENQQIANSQSQSSFAAARKPTDTPQYPIDPDYQQVNLSPNSTEISHKLADTPHKQTPQITIEPATPIVKPTQPMVELFNVNGGCGCVDGVEEMESEVIRTGRSPVFDYGINPVRMNPYKARRTSPLREVESASDDEFVSSS